VPIVDETPSLTCTGISRVQRTVVGEPAYCVLAELYLDSKGSMKAGFASEAWAGIRRQARHGVACSS
jgi:hypothetical protein